MQKKTLNQQLNSDNYNQTLFGTSVKMLNSCRKINLEDLQHHYKNKQIQQSFSKLQTSLNKVARILGKFTQAEKPTLNNQMEYQVEIFEQTKILIQTQIKRIQEEAKTIRRGKSEGSKKEKRPQDIFQIGVQRIFQRHSHQSYLESNSIPLIQPCHQITKAKTIESTSLVYVKTEKDLDDCIEELEKQNQIAVDVEHSQRSYEGLTCLIQISSREKDYIIDVFPVWKVVSKLSKIIENQKILKIMHGAEMDTKWLQRDFNIHIINLFDTHKAARYLGFTTLSYGNLLKHFCGVNTDKSFQRADWRIRPLTPEMLHYARVDTHYLLQIFDNIRLQVQKQAQSMNFSIQNVFKEVQKSSHEVTLTEAELFSYKNKDIYQTLEKSMKDSFKIISKIFFILNQVCYQYDENFQYLAPHKILNEAFNLVKDLISNKNSKVNKITRIDRTVSIFMKSQSQFMTYAKDSIKLELENYFKQKNENEQKPERKEQKMEKQNKKVPKTTIIQKIDEQIQHFERKFQKMSFVQYEKKSFDLPNKKKSVEFKPITIFLSEKYNISKNQQIEKEEEENIEMDDVEEEQQEGQKEDEEKGVIEFKRMKNNVIYTLEEPEEEANKTMLPRKKRKELEYEKRLKDKTGNIYDLLGDDN